MPTSKILDLLSLAPYGAYAVDMGQTIVFWNHSAERILWYRPDAAIGQKCYEVCQSLPEGGSTPICLEGCPAISAAREGAVPPIVHVRMLCASGLRKPIMVTPLVIPSEEGGDISLLVHLLHDNMDDTESKATVEEVLGAIREETLPSGAQGSLGTGPAFSESGHLTNRELEVLRLVALSLDTKQIAEELHLSVHTVLNHIRNARVKLDAPSRLSAVLAARRLGLI